MKFLLYFPHLFAHFCDVLHGRFTLSTKQLSVSKNQYSEIHVLLKGVNKLLSFCLHFVSYLAKIPYNRSAYNAIQQLWVYWKSEQARSYFSHVHKWDFIYACPVKPFDIPKANNFLVISVYCFSGWRIFTLSGPYVFLYFVHFQSQCSSLSNDKSHIWRRISVLQIQGWAGCIRKWKKGHRRRNMFLRLENRFKFLTSTTKVFDFFVKFLSPVKQWLKNIAI